MRRAFSRSVKTGPPDARERIEERMAWLRTHIEQQHREAFPLRRGEAATTGIDEPVRRRWRPLNQASTWSTFAADSEFERGQIFAHDDLAGVDLPYVRNEPLEQQG